MSTARLLCIANQKGGSAKTSTAVNLSCAVALTRRKVLLVDLDPSGDATVALKIPRLDGRGLSQALDADISSFSGMIVPLGRAGFDLLPADYDLAALQARLHQSILPEQWLSRQLQPLRALYDLIVIDTPPALDLITIGALCAADGVLIPSPCEYYALDSLRYLLKKIEELQQQGLFGGEVTGIVRTLFDEGAGQSALIKDILHSLGPLLCETVIPFAAVISEASASGRPVMLYDKSSLGARSYLTLAGEMLRRLHL